MIRSPAGTARRLRRRGGRDGGLSTVETVLVLPALVLLVVTVVQVGLCWYARQVALAAARDAARTARAYGAVAADGTARGYAYVDHVQGEGSGILSDVRVMTTRNRTTVVVTVSGRVASLVPGVSWHVRQVSAGPVEDFAP